MATHENLSKIAVIGSGASAIYLLRHLLRHRDTFQNVIQEIAVFEKDEALGMGMPYNPRTTDLYNLSNISSEELPELLMPFVDWLNAQSEERLAELGLADEKISASGVYNRLALGQYLQAQYCGIVEALRAAGIRVSEYTNTEVTDLVCTPGAEDVELRIADGTTHRFSKVVISTGHAWKEEDDVENGLYASPWPIHKILPAAGTYHNFRIGTLGASLSAFDVVSSLARRHGTFTTAADGTMHFTPAEGAENFRLAMHAADGWLPHLQYEQAEPMRQIYRHVDRESLLALQEKNGQLRLDTYFNRVCRPALSEAFARDGLNGVVDKLADPAFRLSDFVALMSERHEYPNAFEGMREEMKEAKRSVEGDRPIHWKEVMDDLMYGLNFHAEMLPAEDHILFHRTVMPFLMSVIAAMPLPSGNLLLALYDAGRIEVIPGYATVAEDHPPGRTTVEVDDEGRKSSVDYRMFVRCNGQQPVGLDEYPFRSLVEQGAVRRARSQFADPAAAQELLATEHAERVCEENGNFYYYTGGTEIDATYRVIGEDGQPNDRIHDITFTHTTGSRPYSYGLQACSATSQIVVEAWAKALEDPAGAAGDLATVTMIYKETKEL
ncbi:FAD/NAD(P)-binding protein [Neolewinella lacunae]|uniref:FAD/NAD(P)-binding protein n=1 Tax=Neolewinella lacunae TaxID=1517758 RepID=A0A923PF01_9BACT|nr:FAD/NAD(P)-binding protein [Neolewinella lacunae]MBC6992852.1 FAD/NAD(P)-binding protein [Neolewinella lacunae]MDN3633784.1 FAD/NAD(P)-binding protein [Neolewinella lacunae]